MMSARWLVSSGLIISVCNLCNAFTTPQIYPAPPPHTHTSTVTRWSSMPSSDVTASSASGFSGSGVAEVDMNDYNLPLDQIAKEWTANLVPESSLREEGVYLGAKSNKEVMVDTVQVELARRLGKGIGIELLEIAGGREDGYGITVVNAILEGGCAEGSDILIGDSIAAIFVKKIRRESNNSDQSGALSDIEEVESVDTECFGYEKTVEAILGLPPPESEEEVLVFTLKRLRRKPRVTLKLEYPPSQNEPSATFELFSGENLRRAMLTRGVKLNDPLSVRFDSGGMGDCGAEGTCTTCVVAIDNGQNLLNSKFTQEEHILKKNPRWRLACKTIVGHGYREGELSIRVNPRQWDNKHV